MGGLRRPHGLAGLAGMPTNVVKSKRDEGLWRKAKAQAKEAGREDDWSYVMGIYKRMKARQGAARREVK